MYIYLTSILFNFHLKVTFLKDRVMAEQLAKDSLEAMLQGDVDNMRTELGMRNVVFFLKILVEVFEKLFAYRINILSFSYCVYFLHI